MKKQIKYILETAHVGALNAITYKDLARQVGLDDRKCRELVAELVISGDCPIISSSDRNHGGYYVAGSPTDGETVAREGLHRIQQIQRRITGFRLGLQRRYGQEPLFVGVR